MTHQIPVPHPSTLSCPRLDQDAHVLPHNLFWKTLPPFFYVVCSSTDAAFLP